MKPTLENAVAQGRFGAPRPRVMVLFGGRSGEHGISCVTAGGILRAIDRERYDVLAVGITTNGSWRIVSADPDRWEITGGQLPEVPDDGPELLLPTHVPEQRGRFEVRAIEDDVVTSRGLVDVVFPLLHGPYGEDGTLQGALDLLDLRYVGSGVLASAISMDKQFTKVALEAAGLRVAPGLTVRRADMARDPDGFRDRLDALGLPLFVKPARNGSSLGVARVETLDDLEKALDEAFALDAKVLIEAAITGREIECGVLGTADGPPRASLPGEIVVGADLDFYDFGAKYLGQGQVDLRCPADLTDDERRAVQDVAVRAFAAVDAEGLARVDVFVTPDGVIVNEVNTMPGFTPFSMYPVVWRESGIDYPGLIANLIELALVRPVGQR